MKSENTEMVWGFMGFGTFSGDILTNFYDEEDRMGGMIFSTEEGTIWIDISWISDLWPEEGNEPAAWNDGSWHHFALTYDAATPLMSMYIDNVNYYSSEDVATAADLEVINGEEGTAASIEDDNFYLGNAGPGWFDDPGE